jgi:hypothetical protein
LPEGLPEEPRLFYADGVYPHKTNGVGARRAQGFANLGTDKKSVRADRRLRTDDEAIRTQSTIFKQPVFLILK